MQKTTSELAIDKLKAGGVDEPRVHLYVIAENLGFSPEDAAAEWIDACCDSDDADLARQVNHTISECSANKDKKKRRTVK